MQAPDMDIQILIYPKVNVDKFKSIYVIVSLPFQPLKDDILSFSRNYGAVKSEIPNTIKTLKITLDGNANASTIIRGQKAWEEYLYNREIMIIQRRVSSEGRYYLAGELISS